MMVFCELLRDGQQHTIAKDKGLLVALPDFVELSGGIAGSVP